MIKDKQYQAIKQSMIGFQFLFIYENVNFNPIIGEILVAEIKPISNQIYILYTLFKTQIYFYCKLNLKLSEGFPITLSCVNILIILAHMIICTHFTIVKNNC